MHLHTHSEYSELDGLGKVTEYVNKAIKLGHPAVAITDHGQTAGAYDLWYACQGKPIKPILGTEFYISTELGVGHLVALAMNNTGWKNILKLQHYAFTKGFTSRKPCVDMKVLKRYNEGIIVTSACPANPIGHALKRGDYSVAESFVEEFISIFGDRFYLEIQSSTVQEVRIVNEGIIRLAHKYGIELVLTNDCHYVDKEDWYPHEVMLAIQTKAKMSSEKRFKFDYLEHHYKDWDEMVAPLTDIDTEILERALDNTLIVADRCNASIEEGDFRTKFETPNGATSEDYLRKVTTDGYKRIIVETGKDTSKYREDVKHELNVICGERFADYYLVVADYIGYARRVGQPVGDGRGSGVGSKVAYITGITQVDPEPFNLPFERFLSPGRVPDFDVDFANREIIITYLMQKYGANNVATVGAFGTLGLPNCVRRVMSAFDHQSQLINTISKSLEPEWTVDQGISNSTEFAKYAKSHPEEVAVIRRLIGTISNYSTHAGGVLIYKGLSELLPVRTKSEDRTKLIVTLDKIMLEKLGHVKYDVLGLENLTVVQDCLESIKKETGERVNLSTINMEDKNVYDALSCGDVSGVFQLAAQGDAVKTQKPNCFRDIIAINALIRPGTCDFNEYMRRRNGGGIKISPLRNPYMADTYDLYVYQEQYMFDCRTYAGWSIPYSDKNVRKNKKIREDAELEKKFIADSLANGYQLEEIQTIWNQIKETAGSGYGFCQGHATSYGVLSYQTAYLKVKYPTHFYAALMTSKGDNSTEVSNLITEVRSKGIEVLPPNVNTATDKFTAEGNNIYYRITSINGVGGSALKAILQHRPFKSVEDMILRTTRSEIKTNVIISMIKAGCFDFQDRDKLKLIKKAYLALNIKEEVEGTFTEALNLDFQKESLGLYLTSHPLDKYAYKPFSSVLEGGTVITGCSVEEIVVRKDKKGNDMAFLTLNTKHGNVRCLVFSSKWTTQTKTIIESNKFVQITGSRSGESILLDTIKPL